MLDPWTRSFSPLKASLHSTQWYKLFLCTFFLFSNKSNAGLVVLFWQNLAGAVQDIVEVLPDAFEAIGLFNFLGRLLGEAVGEVAWLFFRLWPKNCFRFRPEDRLPEGLLHPVSISSSSSTSSSLSSLDPLNMDSTLILMSSSSSWKKFREINLGFEN